MHKTSRNLVILLVAVLLMTAACKANISRNPDGSFDVETTISQKELQDVITASIADPLVTGVTVSLQSGYVLVNGDRKRLNDNSRTDTLSFRLDLAARGGLLVSVISNAQIDGIAVEQNRVDLWNQKIANRLALFGKNHQNGTLKSLTITSSAVTMTWNVKN